MRNVEEKTKITKKKEAQKTLNNARGITLIALVITIIVLLILAGVTIATLTGDNGILTRAQEAKNKTEQASVDELRKLTQLEAATHLEDYEYIDNSTGEKKNVTIPAQCAVSQVEGENTLADGLVIIDINGNEWVWIEVPKSEMPEGLAFTDDLDYTTLETALQIYANSYRASYTDEWYSEDQHGLTQAEYNDLKKSMLKSVYVNGGFYIGKYEVGIKEDISRNYGTDYATEHPIDETPVIQQDKYVYNWVRCKQAQQLSEGLAISGKTGSLMFGIQWDLVLKYLETNGISQADLKTNSSSWGNYSDVSFNINRGKYSINNGASYIGVKSIYSKPVSSVLLTTGTTKRNSKMNIYDISGNVWEWTLEKSTHTDNPCVFRGGNYDSEGSHVPASVRGYNTTSANGYNIAFRPALW